MRQLRGSLHGARWGARRRDESLENPDAILSDPVQDRLDRAPQSDAVVSVVEPDERRAFYESWALDQASRRSRRDGIAVTVRTERCPPTPGLLEATCADGHAVDCRVRVKPCLSGAHTVEVALLPSTVTRVAIDPDQALADVDRAGSVWTASD